MLKINNNYINELNKYINDFKDKIYNEKAKNVCIIKSTEKILDLTAQYEISNSYEVYNSLKKFNFVLEKNKENLKLLNLVLSDLIVLKDRYEKLNDKSYDFLLSNFNILFKYFNFEFNRNSKEIDLFFDDFVSYSKINEILDNFENIDEQFIDNSDFNNDIENNDTIFPDDINDENKATKDYTFVNSYDFNNFEEIIKQNQDLIDNRTLYISQSKNRVYLPFCISDLKEELAFYQKYKTINELILNDYIIPYSYYLNPVKARFNETFKLMRMRENQSIIKSLNKGLKLAFDGNLNPAIISACHDLHELNTYISCMYTNTLSSFKIFDIKYDIKPTRRRSLGYSL